MNSPLSFHDGGVLLYGGDCLAILDSLAENSVDAIVTDPPYHLASIVKRFGADNAAPAKDYSGVKEGATGAYARASRGFMGKEWDGGDVAFRAETWAKVLRVLKPGGHLVAFSAPKCSHRMVCAIEDAGFEIRDALQWMFGTGFPKSLDVSKAIDRAAGAEREVVGPSARHAGGGSKSVPDYARYGAAGDFITAPATPEATRWAGWGTALKPAFEPICLARKPLSEKSIAANVLRWGTGALNIDATRIVGEAPSVERRESARITGKFGRHGDKTNSEVGKFRAPTNRENGLRNYLNGHSGDALGRWPANVCHDGSEEVVAAFPESVSAGGDGYKNSMSCGGKSTGGHGLGDSGSAARFFYSAKADATDRVFSKHPTVKPVALMRWLVRMVTPPGGTVFDPFAGTGTTGHAALLEGFNAILIEREAEYLADIERRMALVFAGEIERASHAKQESVDALPLFGADNAGGQERQIRESQVQVSRSAPPTHRANRNDEVVTP